MKLTNNAVRMTIATTLGFGVLVWTGAASAQTFSDSFDGKSLDKKVWTRDGSRQALQMVHDGSLRLITVGQAHWTAATTTQGDFDFFKAPIVVVWDLIPERTLAGPYAVMNWSKVFASVGIGPSKGADAPAGLWLAAWPEGFPQPKKEAKWNYSKPHYTLSVGDKAPGYPDHAWALTGIPSRIIWTLDKDSYTVECVGATFADGDKTKRTVEHKLTPTAFTDGHHLRLLTASHAKSMEPGVNFLGGVVYTDAVAVTTPDKIPAAPKRKALPPVPTETEMLDKLLGGKKPKSVPQYVFGINFAGGTFRPDQGFVPPTAKSLDYYKSKGILLMRLPFKWEKLQPTLNGELDAKYLAALKESVQMMADRDMQVLLDLHNYAKYGGVMIGGDKVPVEAFADVWRRLAAAFKDSPNIWGYGLMNEPHIKDSDLWAKSVQACINAIRSEDKKTSIVVAVEDIDGTHRRWRHDKDLPQKLKDPSDNLRYELHSYFDANHSGKYGYTYEYEINRPYANTSPMCGVERIRPYVEWLKKNNVPGLLGEFSVPSNPDRDPRWLVVLDNLCAYLAENEVPSTFWAGGDLWTRERCYVIEPYRGEDRPQLLILQKHAAQIGK